jgi:hypothetical protein
MTARAVFAILAATWLVGCTAAQTQVPLQPPTPSIASLPELARQIRLESDGLEATLTVRDEIRVVTAVSEGAPDIGPAVIRQAAVANPEGNHRRLEVAWTSYPCQLEPALVLTRQQDAVYLILDRGIVPDHCEAMALYWGVTLDLSEAIDATDLTILAVGEALVEPDVE